MTRPALVCTEDNAPLVVTPTAQGVTAETPFVTSGSRFVTEDPATVTANAAAVTLEDLWNARTAEVEISGHPGRTTTRGLSPGADSADRWRPPRGGLGSSARSTSAPTVGKTPRHVTACQTNAWRVWVWQNGTDKPASVSPYRCNSWRCSRCSRRVASKDYTRIKTALSGATPNELTYAVLTFDQLGRYGGIKFADAKSAYSWIYKALSRLMRRLERQFGKLDYIATMEAHRNGWPHINIVFRNRALAAVVRGGFADALDSLGYSYGDFKALGPVERKNLRNRVAQLNDWKVPRQRGVAKTIRRHQLDVGLGKVCWWEPVFHQGEISNYIVKLSRYENAERLTAEVSKLLQLPMEAPHRFRRIRSSRGFLEPSRGRGSGNLACLVRHDDGDASRPCTTIQSKHLWEKGLVPNPATGALDQIPGPILPTAEWRGGYQHVGPGAVACLVRQKFVAIGPWEPPKFRPRPLRVWERFRTPDDLRSFIQQQSLRWGGAG